MALSKQSADKLAEKINRAEQVIAEAFGRFETDKTAVTWTGGKDSTLVLWLCRKVCRDLGRQLPAVLYLDEFDGFAETEAMIERYTREWEINLVRGQNDEVIAAAGGRLGGVVRVADLGDRNRAELARIGYAEDDFIFEAESYVCNHLMKTVPFNRLVEGRGLEAVIQGLRWDEQAARLGIDYFVERAAGELSPAHTRVNPILHFTEADVWAATFLLGVPVNDLYAQGYRSLGAKSTTRRLSDRPAWEQDLARTRERDGRRRDKEAAMAQLRRLGYM